MAVFCLESLVLRGVSVLCGGKADYLRLGTGTTAEGIPSVCNSMSQSLSDNRPDYAQPADGPNPQVPTAEVPAVGGAGRSHGAGVHRRRFPATSARKQASPFGRPAHGLLAVGRVQRSEVGMSWRKPACRIPPTTTRGTRSR
jgi:hypothetical protein